MKFHKGKATDAVFESELPSIQKLILLCYIKHANESGVAWPGGNRISMLTGASIASVKRHRAALMKAGVLIKLNGGDGSVYKFRINLDNLPTGITETPVSEGDRDQTDTCTGVTVIPLPVSERDPNTHNEDHTENEHITASPVLEHEDSDKVSMEVIKSTWQVLMDISEQSDLSSHRLKLTPWRTSMIRQRMKSYTADEMSYAWRWWNESMHDQAVYLRRNRGPAGIDTFLRRSNHDKYQAFAAEWQPVMQEPGPDATIDQMRQWLDYKNRKFLSGK